MTFSFPKTILTFFFFLISSLSIAQTAWVEGRIREEDRTPIGNVNITLKGSNLGTASDDRGRYRFEIPAGKILILVFSHLEYQPVEKELELSPNEERKLDIWMKLKITTLDTVVVKDGFENTGREEASTLKLDPKSAKEIPTPFGDFNQALISGMGLGIVGNSELSASYSVRGGNFDENLVYVNGMMIYRPFLVRAGQQEGLSFVNPDLVKSIEFSSGGWQAKYGDKLSSVLNIDYKKPEKFAGSFEGSLLGGSAHLEFSTRDNRLTSIIGSRYKSSAYLLNTLETQGQYLPKFTDIQSYTNIDLSKSSEEKRTMLGLLVAYANNNYEFRPETRETDFGAFNNVKRLKVAFDGEELMRYQTLQTGLRLTHKFSQKLISDLIASHLITREREFLNIENGYRLCDVDNNISSDTFNDCIFVRGIGTNYQYARNLLDANILGIESRNLWKTSDKIITEFGLRFDYEKIEDQLYEYTFTDSSDYITFGENIDSKNTISSNRYSAYIQQTYFIDTLQTITYGVRSNTWSFNGQTLISPRVQYSRRLRGKKDVVFRASAGLYQQAPFYREMRDFQGNVNKNLKAQQSLHLIAGFDFLFKAWNRPFRFVSEIYYKHLWNVVPYDVDNVRLRYYANNDAVARIYGADFRVNGEIIKGAESWFSMSFMSAQEDLSFDQRGFIRRPTDQRITFAGFFQDHLPNNPSIRFYARALYGTGLPYGLPNNLNLRQAFKNGTDYGRVDFGFSKIVRFKEDNQKGLKTIWMGLEILNAFGIENNISFTWVPDLYGNVFAVPNSLSQRFFNLKMRVNF
jgi:hypothetical protein